MRGRADGATVANRSTPSLDASINSQGATPGATELIISPDAPRSP